MRFEIKKVVISLVFVAMILLSVASLYNSYTAYIIRRDNISYITKAVAAENNIEEKDMEKLTEVVNEVDELVENNNLTANNLVQLNKKLESIENIETTSTELIEEGQLEIDISSKVKEMVRTPDDVKSQRFLKYVIENLSPINFSAYKRIRAADEANQLKVAEFEMKEDPDLAEGYKNGTNYSNMGRCDATAAEVVDILDEIASDVNFFLENSIFKKLISEYNEEITEEDLKKMNAAINDMEYKRIFNSNEYCMLQVMEYFINWQSEGRANVEEAKKMLAHLYKTFICADLEGTKKRLGCLGYIVFVSKIMKELNQ